MFWNIIWLPSECFHANDLVSQCTAIHFFVPERSRVRCSESKGSSRQSERKKWRDDLRVDSNQRERHLQGHWSEGRRKESNMGIETIRGTKKGQVSCRWFWPKKTRTTLKTNLAVVQKVMLKLISSLNGMQRFQNGRKSNADLDVSVSLEAQNNTNIEMVEVRNSEVKYPLRTISRRFSRSSKAKERKGSNSTKHARVKRNKGGGGETRAQYNRKYPFDCDLRFGAMGEPRPLQLWSRVYHWRLCL